MLANGSVVEANGTGACTGACRDVWWASRGGGGGNFGVATRFRLQLQAAPPAILVGQLCWPADVSSLDALWRWLLESYPTMPDWLQIDPGWLPLGTNGSRLFCHTVICNRADEAACRALIAPVATRRDVVLNTLQMRSYLSWQLEHGSVTAAQHGYLYLTNFMMAEGATSIDVIRRLQRAVLASPSRRNLVIFHMGGGQVYSHGLCSYGLWPRHLPYWRRPDRAHLHGERDGVPAPCKPVRAAG